MDFSGWLLAFLPRVLVAIIMILCIAYVTRFAPENRVALATAISFTGVGAGILISSSILPYLLKFGVEWAWAGSAFLDFLLLSWFMSWRGAPNLEVPPPRTIEKTKVIKQWMEISNCPSFIFYWANSSFYLLG